MIRQTTVIAGMIAVVSACGGSTDPPPTPQPTAKTLTVQPAGSGSGTVTSSPAGIDCIVKHGQSSGSCSASFQDGTSVTLTAVAEELRACAFDGWGGDCSGTAPCAVTMSAARNATAQFTGPDLLLNGVPVAGISGARGSFQYFRFPVVAASGNIVSRSGPGRIVLMLTPAGDGVGKTGFEGVEASGGRVQLLQAGAGAAQPRLRIRTAEGVGDLDLYVRFDLAPTLTEYDCRPFFGSAQEECRFVNPPAGDWYILLHGFSDYSGVTLTAEEFGPGRIVLQSDVTGDFDLYVASDADVAGTLQQITSDPSTNDTHPSWSPDRNRIIFQRDDDLWTVNADGSNPAGRVNNARDPDWSPTDEYIVMQSLGAGADIIRCTWTGSGCQPNSFVNLTQSAGVSDIQPVWSPDGRRILFSSNADGDFDLYIMGFDGANRFKLFDTTPGDEFYPDWVASSPDGVGEFFTFQRGQGTAAELWMIDAQGNLNQLTPRGGHQCPAWSPFGEYITFADENGDLHKVRPDGTGLTMLLSRSGFNGCASWSS